MSVPCKGHKPSKIILRLLICLHHMDTTIQDDWAVDLQFTGQEKVVASFGFCFLGGGFADLRFLQQQQQQSQQSWLTADQRPRNNCKRTWRCRRAPLTP